MKYINCIVLKKVGIITDYRYCLVYTGASRSTGEIRDLAWKDPKINSFFKNNEVVEKNEKQVYY